jgi:hypothetical protein
MTHLKMFAYSLEMRQINRNACRVSSSYYHLSCKVINLAAFVMEGTIYADVVLA